MESSTYCSYVPIAGTKYHCRSVQEKDHKVIKELHEEFFPVRYVDQFYDDAVLGKGIGGDELYTLLVIDSAGVDSVDCVGDNAKAGEIIVGFLFGQFMHTNACEERSLFNAETMPAKIFYILTLGIRKEYRQTGLASSLVQMSYEYARQDRECGLIYLHVIFYNKAAIRMYIKNDFEYIKTLSDFYNINGCHYDSYLYARFLNDYQPEISLAFMNSIRKNTYGLFSGLGFFVSQAFAILSIYSNGFLRESFLGDTGDVLVHTEVNEQGDECTEEKGIGGEIGPDV